MTSDTLVTTYYGNIILRHINFLIPLKAGEYLQLDLTMHIFTIRKVQKNDFFILYLYMVNLKFRFASTMRTSTVEHV